jgi:hypothetical protein
MTDPSDAYLGFHQVKGLGPVRLRRLLDAFGDVAPAWDAPPGDLLGNPIPRGCSAGSSRWGRA